jgi:hypothetical protein
VDSTALWMNSKEPGLKPRSRGPDISWPSLAQRRFLSGLGCDDESRRAATCPAIRCCVLANDSRNFCNLITVPRVPSVSRSQPIIHPPIGLIGFPERGK